MKDTERRVRTVHIPQNQVLDWFDNAVKDWPEWISIPVYEGLPSDCQVHSVHFDFMTRCFVFLVQHDSFDPVPDGYCVPQHTDSMKLKYRTFATPRIDAPDNEGPTIIDDTEVHDDDGRYEIGCV